MTNGEKKVGLTISVVAEKYEIHPQTLRTYEREGLIRPSRTGGNRRLYREEDLRRLELILTLTRELGVNLAGVEVVLHMRDKLERMQNDVEGLIDYLTSQLNLDRDPLQTRMKGALMRLPPLELVRVARQERRVPGSEKPASKG